MTKEKRSITVGPAIHPSWPIAHANDKTPDPITAVIMCALAVQTLPKQRNIGLSNIIDSVEIVRDAKVPVLWGRPSSSTALEPQCGAILTETSNTWALWWCWWWLLVAVPSPILNKITKKIVNIYSNKL